MSNWRYSQGPYFSNGPDGYLPPMTEIERLYYEEKRKELYEKSLENLGNDEIILQLKKEAEKLEKKARNGTLIPDE
jgi:hypothetical protein